MTANELITDLSLVRQLLLSRVAKGESDAVLRQMRDMAGELEKSVLSSKQLSEFGKKRLESKISELLNMVKIEKPDLTKIVTDEAKWQAATFAQGQLDATLPPPATLATIASASIVQGATLNDWMSKVEDDLKFGIERQIKIGTSLNETNAEIIKRVTGYANTKKGSEPFKMAYRDAEAIVRTGVMELANDSKMAFFEENTDLIKALKHLSTLDNRTSVICMARSGKQWTYPKLKPIGHDMEFRKPPLHFRCRSLLVSVTKTYKELGLDIDEVTTTRSSMDSQVDSNITFDDFLKSKPKAFADDMLGKGRAELWRKGYITLSDLVDNTGNPLTLDQLVDNFAPKDYVS